MPATTEPTKVERVSAAGLRLDTARRELIAVMRDLDSADTHLHHMSASRLVADVDQLRSALVNESIEGLR